MTVHEIAIREVRAGRTERFTRRRADFIASLTSQVGVLADREFESFSSLTGPRSGPVFIGMTTYESLAANAAIQRKPSVVMRFLRFSTTMNLVAYVYVEPIEGPDFDLVRLAADDGQILEVAVRRVAAADRQEFDRCRRAFVEMLAAEPGVAASWEFEVVKGRKADGLTVGMTVYEDRAAFDDISNRISDADTTQAYFRTFTPVAIEYATSTTNV